MNELINFERLKEFLDYERPSDVIKWLEVNRVPFKLSKRKPVTTLAAINKALIGDENDSEIEFDM